mmetsp:Transcript_1334/g.3131  ORF Transcript_1334/g.3131 Transcript_1334/m.3131 type:complete len:273 (-) Transcript_1334:264-1082(-)
MAPDDPLQFPGARRAHPRLAFPALELAIASCISDLGPSVSLGCDERMALGTDKCNVVVRASHQPVVQQVRAPMRQQGISLHLAKADTSVPLPALHRLAQEVIVRPSGSYLCLVRDQVSQTLVIDNSAEDVGFQLGPMDARIHPICAQSLKTVLGQQFAEVICSFRLLTYHSAQLFGSLFLPLIGLDLGCACSAALLLSWEGVAFVVVSEAIVALVFPERGGICDCFALCCTCFPRNTLDQHPDRHPRWEAVRVEQDVRCDTVLRERHILLWP